MCALIDTKWIVCHIIPDVTLRRDRREKSITGGGTRFFLFCFFLKLNKTTNILCFLIFFFFAYGKFGSHGLFAIYWISRNNGPQCIGATLYSDQTSWMCKLNWTYIVHKLHMDPFVNCTSYVFIKKKQELSHDSIARLFVSCLPVFSHIHVKTGI